MQPTPSTLPRLVLDGACLSAEAALQWEWLCTNGLGGYAFGCLDAGPARRYHGWLVASLSRPRGRHVLVPALDQVLEADGQCLVLGGGAQRPEIAAVPGAWLREFRLEGVLPVWTYEVDGSIVERRVLMPHGRNATLVQWTLLSGPQRPLELRPYLDLRRHDEALPRGGPRMALAHGGRPDHTVFAGRVGTDGIALHVACSGEGEFEALPQTVRDVLFETERARGYDHVADLHSPGRWRTLLRQGQPVTLAIWVGAEPPRDFETEWRREQDRAAALLARAGATGDVRTARWVLAADVFIVEPGTRLDTAEAEVPAAFRSVIAGYPWFADWGRDTMISLEGLTLLTGRHEEARAILHTFGRYVRDGLLPNLFPEGGREALYHTVDATLWFFHAVGRYHAHTGDESLVDELYPQLEEIIERHLGGTRFDIGVDPADGLVHAAAEGYQLTWMDAKVDDWVVTPRRGKPVEIQALWFNALHWMARWAEARRRPAQGLRQLAERAQASFQRRYWDPQRHHLKDVIDGPDGDDASLRPNQVFAISLDHPILARSHWGPVLETLRRDLLTPYGLRTLGPREPAYRPHYRGALRERDAAYHQGTVWPWLLGPYVEASLKAGTRASALAPLLDALFEHLRAAGVGQVSEVFDAQPPHRPEGCVAQAWSVAECLRAWHLVQLARKAPHG